MRLTIPQTKSIGVHMCKSLQELKMQSKITDVSINIQKASLDLKMNLFNNICLVLGGLPTKRRAILGDYRGIMLGDMYDNTLYELTWR